MFDPSHLIVLADNLPNPGPQAPPGMKGTFSDWISWGKYIGMFAGVMGFIACGVMMMVGRRNRSHLAAEGAGGLVWVIAGGSVVTLSVSIVTALMGG
ncbi:hypothetical protein OHS71_41120 (plasmid) [Streptomyces sp. NBC_00377]|uniref:hypothetical protein n=1 Tax=Streptomyces TaxID=1883 RepID=UPI002E1EE119|nr:MULTISPECIES: hypothetical protein [unclassified Streptomyces]